MKVVCDSVPGLFMFSLDNPRSYLQLQVLYWPDRLLLGIQHLFNVADPYTMQQIQIFHHAFAPLV